uniref:Ig-like domain-containing protein n=1 Tax=Varanus komodoensis TaxID=61221 RepID=A0A8D2JFY8_VARKO
MCIFSLLGPLHIAIHLFVLSLLPAVKINAKGREVIYLAKGDSVKLGCPYELEPHDQDLDDLDIEWTQMNSDPTNLDNVILSYHGHLRQRVAFALPDPSRYDASINLQNVELSDTATYECKVKKTTVATRKVTVTVLERPSIPRCSIEGKVAMGRKVTLRCGSQSGTSPLVYKWAKGRIGTPHRPGLSLALSFYPHGCCLAFLSSEGPEPGDLVIQNLSQNHAGVYQCSVANRVGSAQCVLDLSFPEGKQIAFLVGPNAENEPICSAANGAGASGCRQPSKARVHHTPAGPSCAPAQAGPWMNSPAPSPAGSSTAGQEAAPAKGCRPKDYGGVHFKEPTRSREGLVI